MKGLVVHDTSVDNMKLMQYRYRGSLKVLRSSLTLPRKKTRTRTISPPLYSFSFGHNRKQLHPNFLSQSTKKIVAEENLILAGNKI